MHPSVQGEKVKELFGDDVETVYVSLSVLSYGIELTLGSAILAIHPRPVQEGRSLR